LHQSGIENTVASSGTSLTVGQIGMIKRYTPNIKILYDGDPAGIKAAMRGLDMVLEQDMNVKVVLLPTGEDPDSYLKKVGADAFKEYIDTNANDFILFKTQLLLDESAGDPVKRAALIKDIVESIAKVRDPIKRSVYLKECATRLDTDEQILISETNKILYRSLQKRQQQANARRATDNAPPPHSAADAPPEEGMPPGEVAPQKSHELTDNFQEKDIIRLIVEHGDKMLEGETTVATYVLSNIEEVLEEFDDAVCQKIITEAYDLLRSKKPVEPQYFLHHTDTRIPDLAIALIHSPHEYSPNWEDRWGNPMQTQPMPVDNFKRDALTGVNRFKFKKIVRLCEKNQVRLKAAQDAKNTEELMHLLKVQQKLNGIREELGKELGTVGAIK